MKDYFVLRPTGAFLAARLALVALLFGAHTVRADGDYFSPTDERVRLSLGVMAVASSTTVRADPSITDFPGTVIDGEQQFGLPKHDFEPKFQLMFRADTRNRVSVDYFMLDRTGNASLTERLVFRNVLFQPSDPLNTTMNVRMFGIAYGYSFWHSETVELAGTVGLHVTDLSINAKVQTATRHIVQTDDQAGPIPTIGLDGTWVLSKRFYLDGRGQYFNVHLNNVEGSLRLFNVDALYRLRPNVSFALGYSYLKASITSAQSQSGLFDLNVRGPELFVRVGF